MKTVNAVLAMIVAAFSVSTASAATSTIFDTTPGTATNDGVIAPGEYVGSSLGINASSGDAMYPNGSIIGAGSRLYIDSDISGTLSLGLQSAGDNNFGVVVIYIDSQNGGRLGGLNSTVPIPRLQ